MAPAERVDKPGWVGLLSPITCAWALNAEVSAAKELASLTIPGPPENRRLGVLLVLLICQVLSAAAQMSSPFF